VTLLRDAFRPMYSDSVDAGYTRLPGVRVRRTAPAAGGLTGQNV
jgi:hypothetical protein